MHRKRGQSNIEKSSRVLRGSQVNTAELCCVTDVREVWVEEEEEEVNEMDSASHYSWLGWVVTVNAFHRAYGLLSL